MKVCVPFRYLISSLEYIQMYIVSNVELMSNYGFGCTSTTCHQDEDNDEEDGKVNKHTNTDNITSSKLYIFIETIINLISKKHCHYDCFNFVEQFSVEISNLLINVDYIRKYNLGELYSDPKHTVEDKGADSDNYLSCAHFEFMFNIIISSLAAVCLFAVNLLISLSSLMSWLRSF